MQWEKSSKEVLRVQGRDPCWNDMAMSPVVPCHQPWDKSHLPQQVLASRGSRKPSLTPASGTPLCSISRHREGERDHKCCRKFPIHSGIGLLKAFNNGQTLTLVFLNYFAYLKQMPHLIFFGRHGDFYVFAVPIPVSTGRSSSTQSRKSNLNFKEKSKQFIHNYVFKLKQLSRVPPIADTACEWKL